MIIRPAGIADVEPIARVHIRAWEESYRGLIPDAAFDLYSLDTRVARWRHTLGNGTAMVCVAEHDGAVCGFGSAGKARQLSAESEIYSFYLLDAVKRRGAGRMLFAHLRDALAARGFTSLGLWVLGSNVAGAPVLPSNGWTLR